MRRPLLVFGFVLFSLLGASAQDLRWPPTPADRAKVFTEGWPAARDRLEKLLLAYYQPGGVSRPGSTGVRAYASWLQLWKWCELLSRPTDTGSVGQSISPDLLKNWVNDDEFSRLLFTNLSSQDDAPKVLRLLQEIQQAHPSDFHDYQSLAVALAIVYDQPFPENWPHSQVTPSLVPRKDIPVADQFAMWVKSNEAGDLDLDLKTLTPQQLKFVVDAPIDPSEFVWARKNVRFPRMDFVRAFTSVPYDMNRYHSGQYSWTDGPYTLAEIMHRGGICVDQAYYATIAGKAHGLPTLFFTGLGSDGGHAWFGYLKPDGRWVLDCGRYVNQNYVTGETLDPQTWKPITDHELKALTQSFYDSELFPSSQDDLLLAGLFARHGQMDKALRATESAIDVCPDNASAWEAKAKLLEDTNAPVHARRKFAEAAAQQFASDRDLSFAFNKMVASLARSEGDGETADSMDSNLVSQNRGARADLSINVAAGKLAALFQSRQYDDAFNEYRSQLNRLGKAGGATFFYQVVAPTVQSLLRADEKPRANEALSMARTTLNPAKDSILEKEMNALSDKVNQK